MKYKTRSAAQTKKVAKLFAQEVIMIPSRKRALVILFEGDLGAGKTTFIQGLLRTMGVKKKIVSPTFTLLRSYPLPSSTVSFPRKRESYGQVFKTAHHFDCYRIGDEAEVKGLGFADIIKDPRNIVLVEWPEHIRKALPRKAITVACSYGDTLNERTIEIKM